jgi:hypothetical protein
VLPRVPPRFLVAPGLLAVAGLGRLVRLDAGTS